VHFDDGERDALARLETDLSNAAAFTRRLSAGQAQLPTRRAIWIAIRFNALAVLAVAASLVVAINWHQPLMIALPVTLFLIAGVLVVVNLRLGRRELPWFVGRRYRPGMQRRPLEPQRSGGSGSPVGIDVRHAVVVGCDRQPGTDAALRFAFAEARQRSAQLIVVAAFFHPVDPDLDDIEIPDSELHARAHDATEQSLCRALSLPDYRLPPHRIVTGSGDPSRLLLSQYGDAELIIVGTHQRHYVRRLVHGPSTSIKLIRHAHVPVVVVPPD
jgi:nucleotide-binding universal stress UspA family protein